MGARSVVCEWRPNEHLGITETVVKYYKAGDQGLFDLAYDPLYPDVVAGDGVSDHDHEVQVNTVRDTFMRLLTYHYQRRGGTIARVMHKLSDDVRRDQEETAREDNKWYEQRLLLVNGRWKLCSNRKRTFR